MLAAQPNPSLALFRNRPRLPINGVGRLPLGMTINSVTVEPDFVFCAGGGMVDVAEWRPYRYGEALSRVVVATAPTVEWGSPYLGCLDDSVKFNGSDYYQAGNNDFGDIGTEDFVVEGVIRWSTTNFVRLISKYTGGNLGYRFLESADSIRCSIGDATGTISLDTAALTNGVWYHFLCFLDRSGSAQWYIDGVASGAAISIAARAATLTSAIAFDVGSGAGAGRFDSNIAWLAMWKRAAWLDTHLQPAIARERANLVQGVHPYMARGTATPTVQTRASVAHTDKIENDGTKRIYLMGSGALRLADRIDANGRRLKGYLPEVQITNLVLRSGEIDHANWAKSGCTITADNATAPNGDDVADTITEDATAGDAVHGVTHASNISTVSGTDYTLSCWAKKATRDWFFLVNSTKTSSNKAWFNLATGEVGTTEVGVTAGIEDFSDGWYRCWCKVTSNITAANKFVVIRAATADNDTTYVGTNTTEATHLFGVQLEAGVDYPTSYMPTAATPEIREEDILRYKTDDGNIGGIGSNLAAHVSARVLLPNVDNTIVGSIVDLSDNGDTADRVAMQRDASDHLEAISAASGENPGSTAGTTDISNDVVQEVGMPYQTNSLKVTVAGAAEGAEDTDCGMPNEVDRADVGGDATGVLQTNGLVADVEFRDRVVRDNVIPR